MAAHITGASAAPPSCSTPNPAAALVAMCDVLNVHNAARDLFRPQQALQALAELLEPTTTVRESVDREALDALVSILADQLHSNIERLCECSDALQRAGVQA